MSDLFEDDDALDLEDDLDKVDVEQEIIKIPNIKDARIRLEQKLEEKRLRDELDDFTDYDDFTDN